MEYQGIVEKVISSPMITSIRAQESETEGLISRVLAQLQVDLDLLNPSAPAYKEGITRFVNLAIETVIREERIIAPPSPLVGMLGIFGAGGPTRLASHMLKAKQEIVALTADKAEAAEEETACTVSSY